MFRRGFVFLRARFARRTKPSAAANAAKMAARADVRAALDLPRADLIRRQLRDPNYAAWYQARFRLATED